MANLGSLGGGSEFLLYAASDIIAGGTNIVPVWQLGFSDADMPIFNVGVISSTYTKSASPSTITINTNDASEELEMLIDAFVDNSAAAETEGRPEINMQAGYKIPATTSGTSSGNPTFFFIARVTDVGEHHNKAGVAKVKIDFGFADFAPTSADKSLAYNTWVEKAVTLNIVPPPDTFTSIAVEALSSYGTEYLTPSDWIGTLEYSKKDATTGKITLDTTTPDTLVFKDPAKKWIQDAYGIDLLAS